MTQDGFRRAGKCRTQQCASRGDVARKPGWPPVTRPTNRLRVGPPSIVEKECVVFAEKTVGHELQVVVVHVGSVKGRIVCAPIDVGEGMDLRIPSDVR